MNSVQNSDRLVLKFPANSHNIDLQKVIFLVGQGTASASELVIIGLKPYMEVTMIGDTTHGKYTGAWVIPDTEDPPRHNYAMVPIVLKYANADGFTDFKLGLFPDVDSRDDLLSLKPFGSLEDPVLAKAVEFLGGPATKKSVQAIPEIPLLKNKHDLIKSTLIIPQADIPLFLRGQQPNYD